MTGRARMMWMGESCLRRDSANGNRLRSNFASQPGWIIQNTAQRVAEQDNVMSCGFGIHSITQNQSRKVSFPKGVTLICLSADRVCPKLELSIFQGTVYSYLTKNLQRG